MKNKKAQIIVEKLNKLNYSAVENKLSQNGFSTEEIREMKKECLRFLSICATSKSPKAPSKLVDEYWHQMILTTKLYEQTVPIFGQFIHHNPSDGQKETNAKNQSAFWNTVQEYEKVWGRPNLEIWELSLRKTDCRSGCGKGCRK